MVIEGQILVRCLSDITFWDCGHRTRLAVHHYITRVGVADNRIIKVRPFAFSRGMLLTVLGECHAERIRYRLVLLSALMLKAFVFFLSLGHFGEVFEDFSLWVLLVFRKLNAMLLG